MFDDSDNIAPDGQVSEILVPENNADGHTEKHTAGNEENHTDTHEDTRNSDADRYQRVANLIHKPIIQPQAATFHGITVLEKSRRILAVQLLVNAGFAVEQIVEFLPTLGMKLSRTQTYEYLLLVDLPKGYKRSISEQRVHDRYAIAHVTQIAYGAAVEDLQLKTIEIGKKVHPMFRFKADGAFEIANYGFYLEEQMSPLSETRWTDKLKNYYKLFLHTGERRRTLFVTNDEFDKNRARQYARTFLKRQGRDGMNLFLFQHQLGLQGPENKAFDPVWQTAWGEYVSLLQYLRYQGQKPAEQMPLTTNLPSGFLPEGQAAEGT